MVCLSTYYTQNVLSTALLNFLLKNKIYQNIETKPMKLTTKYYMKLDTETYVSKNSYFKRHFT